MTYSFITHREEGDELSEAVTSIVDSIKAARGNIVDLANLFSAIGNYHVSNPTVYMRAKQELERKLGGSDYAVIMEWIGFRLLEGEYSCFDFGTMSGYQKRILVLVEALLKDAEV